MHQAGGGTLADRPTLQHHVHEKAIDAEREVVEREPAGSRGDDLEAARDLRHERTDKRQEQQPEGQRSRHLGLHGLDNRWHDLEQVADDAVVGDFEDRGVGILVDGDDGVRALHSDEVLNGA